MSHTSHTPRPVPALLGLAALTALLTGCRTTTHSPTGFNDYIALGDSLTAGMQSAGLTPQNQRESFPVVLSKLAGAPIHAPVGREPGCPPPMGAMPGVLSCMRVEPFQPVSNFGIPGARLADVLGSSHANVSDLLKPLYGLVLGPQDTQVSAALRARPQFITLWVGANDVLGVSLRGDPSRATPPTTFKKQYAQLLDALAPAGARTVLITVPNISDIPGFIPGPRLTQLGLADASCANSENRVSLVILNDRRLTKPVSCTQPYALTPEEARKARETVQAYNTAIHELASARGYPVFDADEFLREATPAQYDPKASMPFGPDFSLDGIHPSTTGYARIARGLAAFMNKTFGTRIPVEQP